MSITPSANDPTHALAAFAASLRFDDIPDVIVKLTKRMILDSMGAAIAASTLGPGCAESMTVMRDLGGPEESTILGIGGKVAAPNAAFANGALVHALNYDPAGSETGHLGVVCLVAPLAMAEAVSFNGNSVSGRAFLTASIVACEVKARITAALVRAGVQPSNKFMPGQLLSYLPCAAGAAKILNLDAEKFRSALGLALMQSAGSRQPVLSGDPPAKAIYGAFPNQVGVLSARLAEAGLGADMDAFNPPAGLFTMIYGDKGDRSVITNGLGSEYLLIDVEFKAWPASNHVTPFIEAAQNISAQGVTPEDIVAVEIVAHPLVQPWCEPLAQRRRPDNAAAAGNSIPFCVAKTLAHGDIGLADFTIDGLNDPIAHAVADRFSYRLDESMKGGSVRIETRGGEHIEKHIPVPLGHPTRPISDERLRDKFRDCCKHSATPLGSHDVERLIAMIDALETLDDISRLTSLATGRA
jgi:2-methylcitrate dehydratase PrpD